MSMTPYYQSSICDSPAPMWFLRGARRELFVSLALATLLMASRSYSQTTRALSDTEISAAYCVGWLGVVVDWNNKWCAELNNSIHDCPLFMSKIMTARRRMNAYLVAKGFFDNSYDVFGVVTATNQGSQDAHACLEPNSDEHVCMDSCDAKYAKGGISEVTSCLQKCMPEFCPRSGKKCTEADFLPM